ncbi:MAG: hypothetical protein CO073_03315 [Candidatus Komeilibacteria bacterium CG_4_9_14_0_8_um_filter_36_9]|uniref:Uncharacterized protein n=1 Tax=Candidatus Komeilibacteria bacterium CG_4_9_14_0_8_um_filter_36_9 TaxID=1974473 RepID=A0A2M8DQN1_9BACT|nr:MAG: hypothetical protein CO073_03315 [Candidatus Komeilibacteria bacterium CG_4_9_14_0_8_um_filter_36_9]
MKHFVVLIFIGMGFLFTQEPDDLVFEYTTYDGRVIEMSYDRLSGCLQLQVFLENNYVGWEGEWLEILKEQVSDLTNKVLLPVELENPGYTLHYMGGYPIWGPYMSSSIEKEGLYRCLMFSDYVEISGYDIYVWGTATKRPYYPYDEEAGDPVLWEG